MNTFPLISPAAYYAAQQNGVAVVQSLQNYRLLCAGAYLMREGRVCLDCVGKRIPWPSVRHACYRDSRLGSAVVAGMLVGHRMLGTWKRKVNRFIACSQIGRDTFVRGGLPAEKIAVKPNFIHPVPKQGRGDGDFFLFVGRLSPEKGIESLLKGWQMMSEAPALRIVGDGPLRHDVQVAAAAQPAIQWLGWRPHDEVLEMVGDASALLLPSTWYEGFPKTLLESIAKGTPVIASQLGSMAEVIRPGINGDLFEPGNAPQMVEAVRRFTAARPCWRKLRESTRATFLASFTADRNYELLMMIYRDAIRDQLGHFEPVPLKPHLGQRRSSAVRQDASSHDERALQNMVRRDFDSH